MSTISKSELKNSTANANSNSANDVSIDMLVKAVNAENSGKVRADEQGNKRRLLALQLATTFPDTHGQWKAQVIAWHSKDSEQRDACRQWALAVLDAGDEDTVTKRNVVAALMNSVTFAVDVIAGNYADDIVIGAKTAFICGGSRLNHACWRVMKWSENSKLTSKRSADMDMALVSRSADKDAGSAVSWAVLSDVIRDVTGRKATGRAASSTVTASKPIAALEVISGIAAAADASHFRPAGARIQSIDTAQDILALALDGEECKALDAQFTKLFEQARDLVRTLAAATVAAAKGNPDAADKIKATIKAVA